MRVYPLESIGMKEAQEKQFKMVDEICKVFPGYQGLNLGDLGVHPKNNQPQRTALVEEVFANFFDEEDAVMVRGAGTGAIREALSACSNYGDHILVHTSPIYSTTITSFEMLGLTPIKANFNDLNEIRKVLQEHPEIKLALIQYTRQSLEDAYNMEEVIQTIKETANIPIITDDNYAVMKVSKIGTELGADLSCFSNFKLLGPEGIGTIVGKKKYIDKIRSYHYSGGTQVQGHEAMEAMRGMVYAPVSLAIQAQELEKIASKLNKGDIPEIKQAIIVNAQSKVLLVEFHKSIAKEVLQKAEELGASPYPVGAESKYEIAPMFYRVSGTMRKKDPVYETNWIRINPMRSGSHTVLRILKEAIEKVR